MLSHLKIFKGHCVAFCTFEMHFFRSECVNMFFNDNIFKVSIITVLILMLEVCHGQGSLVTSKQDDLLCNICVDIVEDIDSWLTSDTTEQQIVDWLYAFCEVDLKEQNIIFIQCFL